MFTKISTALILISVLLTTNLFAQTDEYHLDEVYPIDAGGTINLVSDDADVWITGSDRDDVRIIVDYRLTVKGLSIGQSDEFEMIVEQRNGDLYIREKPRDIGVSFMIGESEEDYTIEIQVPHDVHLDIDGDDGEYEIVSIDGSLRADVDDSEFRIADCNGGDFDFSMDDGRLEMDGGNGRLRIEADDGDVRIDGGAFTDISAESDDSDIEITTSLYDNGNYRFEMDDGDLTLNITGGGGEFNIDHDNADVHTTRHFEEMRDDEDLAIYRLMGGNARVKIESDDGDINLRVY